MTQSADLRRLQLRTVLIWGVLLISTLGAWLWMERMQSATAHKMLVCIIGLAAIKVTLIITYYMEINLAPRWLQLLCALWLSVVFSLIAVIYLLPEQSLAGWLALTSSISTR